MLPPTAASLASLNQQAKILASIQQQNLINNLKQPGLVGKIPITSSLIQPHLLRNSPLSPRTTRLRPQFHSLEKTQRMQLGRHLQHPQLVAVNNVAPATNLLRSFQTFAPVQNNRIAWSYPP